MHLSGLILVTEVSGVCAYQTASFSFSSGVALCADDQERGVHLRRGSCAQTAGDLNPKP